jgi:hypothetical protein
MNRSRFTGFPAVVSASVIMSVLLLSSFATVAAENTSTSSVPGPTSQYSAWQQAVTNLPPPSAGCYTATYPIVAWVGGESSCGPAQPMPETVGNGNEHDASISSGYIGESQGYVSSETNVNSESDNGAGTGSNYYTIQVNSNGFTCNTPDTGNINANCWEQFIFRNPGSGNGYVEIQYWLWNYVSASGPTSCPSTHTYTGAWTEWPTPGVGPDCYSTTFTGSVGSSESPLSLTSYQVKGYADNGGYDEPVFCNGPHCNAIIVNYGVLDLAAGWTSAEWNVLGFGGGSTACFNGSGSNCSPSGSPSVTVEQYLYNSAGTNTASSCLTPTSPYFSGEENDLSLGTCTATSSSPYYIYFTMT